MHKVKISVYIYSHILQHYETKMEKKIEEPQIRETRSFLSFFPNCPITILNVHRLAERIWKTSKTKLEMEYRDPRAEERALPVDIKREDILGQDFGSHGRVKHWRNPVYRNGGVCHSQDAIKTCHREHNPRLFNRLCKLLVWHLQPCQLQTETNSLMVKSFKM